MFVGLSAAPLAKNSPTVPNRNRREQNTTGQLRSDTLNFTDVFYAKEKNCEQMTDITETDPANTAKAVGRLCLIHWYISRNKKM